MHKNINAGLIQVDSCLKFVYSIDILRSASSHLRTFLNEHPESPHKQNNYTFLLNIFRGSNSTQIKIYFVDSKVSTSSTFKYYCLAVMQIMVELDIEITIFFIQKSCLLKETLTVHL